MKLKITIVLIIAVLTMTTFSNGYNLPTQTTRRITGTFGEYRSGATPGINRFNIGLAISTNSMENTKIFAMNNGYLWKLVLNHTTYGNMIYVRHPDGMATVYAHLNDFSRKFDDIIESVMVEFGEASNVEIELQSNEYPIKSGEVIGYSGKTGIALAPYCHIEFYDIKRKTYIDPLVFLKERLNQPDALLELIKVRIDGTEKNISQGGTYRYSGQKPQIELNTRLADHNWRGRFGVHRIQLFLNGEEVYQLLFETIPEDFYEKAGLVYGEGSTSSYYWYKLYSDVTEGTIVINKLKGMASLPATTKARIVVEDDWGNVKEWSFYLKQ